MSKGGLTIIFRRSPNDNEAFYKHGSSIEIPSDSKIAIKTIEICIPLAEYETNHPTLLKANMVKNPIVPVSFLNSQTIEKIITGRTAEIDITTQFNSLSFDMP